MAEILSILSIVAFAVAGVCLVLAAFFWFFFKIPTVIGDLTGRTARKSIAKLRAANEKSGNKTHKESKENAARGKVTAAIPKANSNKVETGILSDNQAEGGVAGVSTEAETVSLEIETTVSLGISPTIHAKRTGGKTLVMLEEVILTHTNEVIQ